MFMETVLAPFEVGCASRPSVRMGFSTLEMLVAMTIIIMTLTAVTLTSFGGQTLITDSQTSTEALNKAQELLERTQLLARKDFKLVNPTTTVETLGGLTYTEVLSVSTTTAPDYATKKITATVTWPGEHGRTEHVSLSALAANFDHAVAGDTCDSVLAGNWTNPVITNTTQDFIQLIATSTGTNVISSVDAHKGKLYVTVGNTLYPKDPTFFIFDIATLKTNPTAALLGKLDNAPTTATGLFSLHVAEGTTTGSMYAYVANENPSNWGTCSVGPNCAQLQIMNASDPAHLTLASTTNFKIPNTGVNAVTGSAGQGTGNSIFYKDGLIYLGLTKTGSGPEFNIIDVHNPALPSRVGSYTLGATIYSVTVVGDLAYLATKDNSKELVVLNVSNPTNPTLASSYNASGAAGFGFGQTLYTIGDSLYFGRTYVNGAPELYVLDASSSKTTIPDPPLGTFDVGVSASPYTIYGLVVRDYLAFVAGGSPSAGGKLRIFNVRNPANITEWSTPFSLPNNSIGYALDCEGNDLFVSSDDSSNQGYLSVITSSP